MVLTSGSNSIEAWPVIGHRGREGMWRYCQYKTHTHTHCCLLQHINTHTHTRTHTRWNRRRAINSAAYLPSSITLTSGERLTTIHFGFFFKGKAAGRPRSGAPTTPSVGRGAPVRLVGRWVLLHVCANAAMLTSAMCAHVSARSGEPHAACGARLPYLCQSLLRIVEIGVSVFYI